MNWRPKKGWKNPFNPAAIFIKDRNNKPVSHYDAFEEGADAMCKAKDEARRPVKEVRLKLIDVNFGYMSMSEFVDWMYGEVER